MNKLNQSGNGVVAIIVILLVVGVVSFAGWKAWGSKTDNTTSPDIRQNTIEAKTNSNTEKTATQNTKAEKVTPGILIKTGESEFGTMLFDEKGQAIYIWELEESTTAECYGDCAKAWPPVITNGLPRADAGVKNELLGTTKRTDGSTQVTYNGHPLYYYAHEQAGEVKCHNISTHGGLWWVVQPSGVRAD